MMQQRSGATTQRRRYGGNKHDRIHEIEQTLVAAEEEEDDIELCRHYYCCCQVCRRRRRRRRVVIVVSLLICCWVLWNALFLGNDETTSNWSFASHSFSYGSDYQRYFGSPHDAAWRSQQRRKKHEHQQQKQHVNFLDALGEFHSFGHMQDKIFTQKQKKDAAAAGGSSSLSYRVGKSGMLLRIGGPPKELDGRKKGTGYAPSGGALPRPQTMEAVTEFDGEWSQVDQFTCLGNYNDGNNRHPVWEWQTRAPYVILLGTMKGGTQALTTYLWQHEQFVKKDQGMEIHFFGNIDYQQTPMGIPVKANQEAYAYRFQKSHSQLFQDAARQRHVAYPNRLALDSTPYYLMGTNRIPQAICCVTPWVKMIALLRNPVDRIESHFRYTHVSRWQNQKPMVDWDVWIERDIQLLKETGVIRDWNKVSFDQYAGSVQEFEAWKQYLTHPDNVQQIVGRGLYAIQLEHYYKVMKACHNKPETDLLVVQSEALRRDTQGVYNQVLQFLQLTPYNLTDARAKHTTDNSPLVHPPMPIHIRQELISLFRPYNQRLYKLLHWDSVWEE